MLWDIGLKSSGFEKLQDLRIFMKLYTFPHSPIILSVFLLEKPVKHKITVLLWIPDRQQIFTFGNEVLI